MQTFLPSLNYSQSAKWIDRPSRLGKQRPEGLDCLKLNLYFNYDIPRKELDFPEFLIKRYGNHPCRKMWAGYEWSLWQYCYAIIVEWREMGYIDNCFNELHRLTKYMTFSDTGTPPWLTEEFASNHRAILLGKAWETFLTVKAQKYELNKSYLDILNDKGKTKRKLEKARAQLNWYQQFDWPEQPAERNDDGKWPYLWPEMVK